jgi:hypothetical protein
MWPFRRKLRPCRQRPCTGGSLAGHCEGHDRSTANFGHSSGGSPHVALPPWTSALHSPPSQPFRSWGEGGGGKWPHRGEAARVARALLRFRPIGHRDRFALHGLLLPHFQGFRLFLRYRELRDGLAGKRREVWISRRFESTENTFEGCLQGNLAVLYLGFACHAWNALPHSMATL